MTLSIVGCGIDPGRHLTLEAADLLRAADTIVTLMPWAWVARLPSDVAAVCESLFDEYYVTGRPRTLVYAEVAQLVASRAATSEVVFAVQGSPAWYDSIVALLQKMCREAGTPYRLVAGVSAVEAVLTRLGESVAPSLHVTDAASLVEGGEVLDARHPTLILQPHVAMSAAVMSGVATPGSTLAALGRALCATFPIDHEIIGVAVVGEWAEERLYSFTVGDLCDGHELDLRGATLFLRSRMGVDGGDVEVERERVG